jgi:hypothetical protein
VDEREFRYLIDPARVADGTDPAGGRQRYDRAFLLLGPKRNDVLTLPEVLRYGADSFGDPDYLRLYGMTPAQWYARGVRLLGRTAVECTRDDLARAIGRDVAAVAAADGSRDVTVVDPFAGSGNTIYWILRHVPRSTGLAFELDPQVYALSRHNLAGLDRPVTLAAGDYQELLDDFPVPPDDLVVVFVAPPWGTALDEVTGLDLLRTSPPVTDVVATLGRRYAGHRMIYAVQVYAALEPDSLGRVRAMFDWSQLRTYDLNTPGGNHGILLGATGWRPPDIAG